jgi:hypothetical protein
MALGVVEHGPSHFTAWWSFHSSRCALNSVLGGIGLMIIAVAPTNSLPWWSWPTLSMSNLSQTETESSSDNAGYIPHTPPEIRPQPRKPHKSPPPEPRPEIEPDTSELDTIHQLLLHPALFDPLRTPRYPIVLSHGAVHSAPTGAVD